MLRKTTKKLKKRIIKEQAQLLPLVVSGKLRLRFFFFIIIIYNDDELTTSRELCVVRCLALPLLRITRCAVASVIRLSNDVVVPVLSPLSPGQGVNDVTYAPSKESSSSSY
jgi:hypothetical protein